MPESVFRRARTIAIAALIGAASAASAQETAAPAAPVDLKPVADCGQAYMASHDVRQAVDKLAAAGKGPHMLELLRGAIPQDSIRPKIDGIDASKPEEIGLMISTASRLPPYYSYRIDPRAGQRLVMLGLYYVALAADCPLPPGFEAAIAEPIAPLPPVDGVPFATLDEQQADALICLGNWQKAQGADPLRSTRHALANNRQDALVRRATTLFANTVYSIDMSIVMTDLPIKDASKAPAFANFAEKSLFGVQSVLATASVDRDRLTPETQLRARLLLAAFDTQATSGACALGGEAARVVEAMP